MNLRRDIGESIERILNLGKEEDISIGDHEMVGIHFVCSKEGCRRLIFIQLDIKKRRGGLQIF